MTQRSIHRPDSEASSHVDIIHAVAERRGVDPTELSPPLYDAVDPDHLDDVLDKDCVRDSLVVIEFEYAGFDVAVRSDGTYTLN